MSCWRHVWIPFFVSDQQNSSLCVPTRVPSTTSKQLCIKTKSDHQTQKAVEQSLFRLHSATVKLISRMCLFCLRVYELREKFVTESVCITEINKLPESRQIYCSSCLRGCFETSPWSLWFHRIIKLVLHVVILCFNYTPAEAPLSSKCEMLSWHYPSVCLPVVSSPCRWKPFIKSETQ